ncbi:hypothetical protein [Rhodopseudomonas palustris]|uniref:Uncharacterized protein n=1 Tax=Rhodopseudomonas palustris (strain BisB18) TaxID=316056 RepID=Q20YS1_RHOPB
MIAIYEPLYRPGQTLVEPAFKPLLITDNNRPEWREFAILVDMYRRGLHRQHRFTGLFSPKFGLKTGLSGAQFIDFVNANADAEVCFVNPFPQLAYISFNVWMQGENAHPGLVARAQALLDACGIAIRVAELPRHGPDLLCYCNFWVGTEQFWEDYVGGVLVPMAEFLEAHPEHPACRDVLKTTVHIPPSPFLPFIVERLFSSYLSLTRSPPLARGFPTDPLQFCLNDFERRLVIHNRDRIDSADQTGVFSDEVKKDMRFASEVWQDFTLAYYGDRPHPHSGGSFQSVGAGRPTPRIT